MWAPASPTPCFTTSASVYYCQCKLKNKNRVGLSRGCSDLWPLDSSSNPDISLCGSTPLLCVSLCKSTTHILLWLALHGNTYTHPCMYICMRRTCSYRFHLEPACALNKVPLTCVPWYICWVGLGKSDVTLSGLTLCDVTGVIQDRQHKKQTTQEFQISWAIPNKFNSKWWYCKL